MSKGGNLAGMARRRNAMRGKQWLLEKKPTKKKSGAKPTNPSLYSRVKAEAKRKFDVYPSAYANAWAAKNIKRPVVVGKKNKSVKPQ